MMMIMIMIMIEKKEIERERDREMEMVAEARRNHRLYKHSKRREHPPISESKASFLN